MFHHYLMALKRTFDSLKFDYSLEGQLQIVPDLLLSENLLKVVERQFFFQKSIPEIISILILVNCEQL